MCCMQEVRLRGQGTKTLWMKGRRYKLWWSGKEIELVVWKSCNVPMQDLVLSQDHYIGKTKRHLVIRVQKHLSWKLGKTAIHEHISSCKDCHSCSISNFHTLAQANTEFEAKIKEALYI